MRAFARLRRCMGIGIGIAYLLAPFVSSNTYGETKMHESFEPQQITAEIAGRYAMYAMMSSNSYHKGDRVKFIIEDLGWTQIDQDGKQTAEPTKKHPVSGLAYDIYEQQGTENVVWAIRGTDSKSDYIWANFAVPPLSLQYKQVLDEFRKYREKHPGKKIIVTGHSLGGGLALSISVHYGIDAITFDSSPRIFDGLRDKHEPASRVLIYEGGEILQHVRRHWKKIFEVVSTDNIHQCSFDFKKISKPKKASKHRSDYLALGLLDLGKNANGNLNLVRVAPPSNP